MNLRALTVSLTVTLLAMTAVSAQTEPMQFKLYVQNFSELTVVDGVNVDYRAVPDSAGWAVFTCLPEKASQLMFTNNRNKLTIQTAADEHPLPDMPRVTVYSEKLQHATNTGDSTLRLLTLVPVERLKIKQMGNGHIDVPALQVNVVDASVDTGCGTVRLAGKAGKAKLRNVGTGCLDASKLVVDEASIFIAGPGPVETSATKKIVYYGFGPGMVISHVKAEKVSNRSIGVRFEQRPVETDSITTETTTPQ